MPHICSIIKQCLIIRSKGIAYLLCSTLCINCSLAGQAADVVIITNKQVPLTEIDKSLARSIYIKSLRVWANGVPVVVYTLPSESDTNIRFSQQILGAYPYQIESAWERLIFSGGSARPITVKTQQEMIEKIKSTPGAIGFIDKSLSSNTDVQVIEVKQ